MERIVQATADGSHTISIPDMAVTYHSRHGAIQESMHVFIDAGFRQLKSDDDRPVAILEMGFGTGLNALLTLMEQQSAMPGRHIWYYSVEAFPLEMEVVETLNYCQLLGHEELQETFLQMHLCEWNQPAAITPHFTLTKHLLKLDQYISDKLFDCIYFDAFAPNAQPELWTKAIFLQLWQMTIPGGILVTYCSKGDVRRALQAAGWMVEKIPGPPGKREMVRGRKM
jgi:tRNA U34 5-methylaminomethyl-2-thiouridine-forming methyltransferase MnmC